MVSKLMVVEGTGTDPYQNLALEKLLLERVAPGQCILYLWQNANTVVIGRNQSALDEVRVAELMAAGGHLARRLSGGGAVYHDLGNLNFTFVCRGADYDVARQTEVILAAVRALGIPAERTGRNDLTAVGGKFSGHAYYRSGVGPEAACYHHGTLMVDVDMAALGRYLKPASDKLAAKGVQSVRSRVTNLSEHRPGLTVGELSRALKETFGATFGLPVRRLPQAALDTATIDALTQHFASDAWLFRDDRELDHHAHGRFPWGGVTVRYALAGGVVSECLIVSDGLEADYLERVPAVLQGCVFEPTAVRVALMAAAGECGACRSMAVDLVTLLFG